MRQLAMAGYGAMYGHVGGNPTSFVDPWGLMREGSVAGGKKREDCKSDECVDVVAPHPCPGAPAGVSCEAWKAFKEMQLRMLLDRYRPTSRWPSQGSQSRFFAKVSNAIAQNTDFGVSASFFYRGWWWSLDQFGAKWDGRWSPSSLKDGLAANTQSWVVGVDVFVALGPDSLRASQTRLLGFGVGWPGFGRLPGVEVLLAKNGGVVGISLHWGLSFFFPPGWVTEY